MRLHQKKYVILVSGQLELLLLLLCIGISVIVMTLEQTALHTLLLFIFVVFGGLISCRIIQEILSDPKLIVLGYFWLVKLGLTLFLLYVGWIPQLEYSSSSSWGYDPQRYYQDAFDLIENGWIPIGGSYYQGIIFYYGAIFYLFGHNPLIPALINAFVTLLGTLYLIRLAYEFKGQRSSRDWTLAFTLLIPEVLWYDVITSRETLVAVLVLVATLASGRYIVRSESTVSLVTTVLLSGASLLAILAVRTSMAIPIVLSIVLMALILSDKRTTGILQKYFLVGLALGLFAIGPAMQKFTGGSEINYLEAINIVTTLNRNIASNVEWSGQSIGLLLAPNNWWQSIVYLPPRMVLYLIAPLPNFTVSISELSAGSWFAWQSMMGILTSMINILAIPYALAGSKYALKYRTFNSAPLVLHLSFWVTFTAVAGGNIIIHERYRLMMILLFYGSVWLGYTSCNKVQVWQFAILWYSSLGAGILFYLFYKFV